MENESASPSNRIQTYEQHKRIEYTGHKPYKTAVGNGMREIIYELPPDAVEIIFLEDAVNAEMIAYKYCRYLALRHTVLTVPVHHTRHLAVMADADFLKVRHSNPHQIHQGTEDLRNFEIVSLSFYKRSLKGFPNFEVTNCQTVLVAIFCFEVYSSNSI